MKYTIKVCIILISTLFSQGFYGSIGYRMIEPTEPIDLNYVYQGFNWLGPDYLTNVTPNNYFILGTGYKWITSDDILSKNKNFGNIFISMSMKNFDYEGDDYDAETISWFDWGVGAGYGTKFYNGLTISADLEYNFTVLNDLVTFDEMPSDNFFTLNINLGYMDNKNKSEFGHFGIFGSKIMGDYFLNGSGPTLNTNQISLESGYLGIVSALTMVIVPIAIASGGDLYPPSSSPTTSSVKGCHVYGKIKFVDYGEDYKIKFVNYGENLKIKYVSYGADSPGAWKVVKYGEDFKVKIVKYGEDFKVKEVTYGQGCN